MKMGSDYGLRKEAFSYFLDEYEVQLFLLFIFFSSYCFLRIAN